MNPYRYVTADVFTQTAIGGNQLAVPPDARGIDDALMLYITREFNCFAGEGRGSETVFVFPLRDPRHDLGMPGACASSRPAKSCRLPDNLNFKHKQKNTNPVQGFVLVAELLVCQPSMPSRETRNVPAKLALLRTQKYVYPEEPELNFSA